ncbi:MAG: c-type cytochrome [Pseudomonadota bacterium]
MKKSLTATLTMMALLTAAPSFAEDAGHPLFKDGDSLFKDFCSHCHGINMVNPGNSSYDLRKWPVANKKGFVGAVMKGKGDMPAWGDILFAEEVDALWIYVIMRAGKEPFPADETDVTPTEDLLAEIEASG